MKKRGPKTTDLATRIRKHVSPSIDLDEAFENYPRRIGPCLNWTGNAHRIISSKGSSQRVIRAMFEIACCEPLHEAWRPVNVCGNGNCVNPTHYDLRAHKLGRYDGLIPLPVKLRPTMSAAEAAAQIAEMDPVAEVLDFIDGFYPHLRHNSSRPSWPKSTSPFPTN